jgi:tetratricopeptide (TPR) repeat protein
MSQGAADTLVREGDALFREERFGEAAARFERAVAVFPRHSLGWRGLGHALLCMGRPHDAARAFDQAIGLRPDSATALWGGALAHAEIGNKVIARDYLRRTIALQPSWAEMALTVPALASFLQVCTRAADRLHAIFGVFATQRYHHANHPERYVDIGRIQNVPAIGITTFVTIGLSNAEWQEAERPRIELMLASTVEPELKPGGFTPTGEGSACAQILANLTFHLAETRFFPEPGTMVRDVVGALDDGDLSRRLPHIYVQVPKAWGVELPLDEGPPAVTLAQVLPISEQEYQAWRSLGAQRFEQQLIERAIDVTDLRRTGD